MIQQRTVLMVGDNSGARRVRCIKVLGGFKRRVAVPGDIIIVTVHQLRNRFKERSKVKRGDVLKALIVYTKVPFRAKDGRFIKMKENKVLLLNKSLNPIGTRIFVGISTAILKKKLQKYALISRGIV